MASFLTGAVKDEFCILLANRPPYAVWTVFEMMYHKGAGGSRMRSGNGDKDIHIRLKIIFYFHQFSPENPSTVPHHRHYALEIAENTQPIIDHCKIKSLSVGELFFYSAVQ